MENKNNSSKVKSVALIVVLLLMFVVICGLTASIVTGTKPQDWFNRDDKTTNAFEPINSIDVLTMSDTGDGKHLYINTDKTALDAAKSYADKGGKVILIAFLHVPFTTFDDVFSNPDMIGFFIFYEGNSLKIMFEDESCVTIYNYTSQEFGQTVDQTSLLDVKEDGKLVLNSSLVEEKQLKNLYAYSLITIFPDDFTGDMSKDSLWSVEEINKIFAFSPFNA